MKIQKVLTCYLAGPIKGHTFDGAQSWRDAVAARLTRNNVKTLSPLRGMEYLKKAAILGGDHGIHGLFSGDRAIMTRDFYDATHCDVMLVNFLGAEKVSIGTCMEVAWAYQARIPVVLCIEDPPTDQKPGNPHDYLMIREAAGYVVRNLEDACRVVGMFADNGQG